MKQTRLWLCICLAAIFLSGSLFAQAKSLTIGSASGNSAATIPIILSTDEPVEGFVVSVQTDTAKLNITDISCAVADAEFIQPEILADGATLGVVMDSQDPFEGQVIPAGETTIAHLSVSPITVLPCGEQDMVAIELVDGLNNPPLNNTVVVEGMSITQAETLALNNGSYRIEGACSPMSVVSATGLSSDPVEVDITLDNGQEVEGYVVSIQNSEDVTLDAITTEGTAAGAVGIEFEASKIYPNGGTLGVVFDYEAPWDGQVLPAGNDQTIATYIYSVEPFVDLETPDAEKPKVFDIEFVDGVFGSPPLSCTIVSGGMSLSPTKENGQVTFEAIEGDVSVAGVVDFTTDEPEDPEEGDQYINTGDGSSNETGQDVQANMIYKWNGTSWELITTEEGDEVTDEETGETVALTEEGWGTVVTAIQFYADGSEAAAGGEGKVTLSYTSEDDPIQGLSMSISYPDALTIMDVDGDGSGMGMIADRNLEGTVTEGIDAEFVSFNAEAGELVVGILVDSTPPIPINHMYPTTGEKAAVLNVFFGIPEDASCDAVFPISFVDGLTGAGSVAISNRVSVFNESMTVSKNNGVITIGGGAKFIRGDCNSDGLVDIADPAATMAYLFLGLYSPGCMDACDSDDSGMVDLADVVNTLSFLFLMEGTIDAPYPEAGTDDTPDMYNGIEVELGCEIGNPCPEE